MNTDIYFKRYIKNDPGQKKVFCLYPNGTRWWNLNGKLHRVDGPAVERIGGIKSWYLNGEQFYKEDYWKALEKYKENNK